jgi:hypothetical protein
MDMADTARPAGVTRQIPRNDWKAYLERFTREHLTNDPAETATVEVLSPQVGDQYEARGKRLLGVTYDSRTSTIEVLLEDVDHLVYRPVELWVIEGADGFIMTMELLRADGTKEILHIQRGGAPAPIHDVSAPLA